MLAVGGTALADIYCDIEDGTFHTTDEFALGEGWTLEMQATHHAVGRFAFIVLNKGHLVTEDGGYLLVEFPLREGFEEIATGIGKDARFYDENSVNICFYYVHLVNM